MPTRQGEIICQITPRIHKGLLKHVCQLSCFFAMFKNPSCRSALRNAPFCMLFNENREQLREWDWIPLREGFSHSPKRGNNSVPLPTKTSQLLITYKWEHCALECIWGWAARSYQRGALAPKHKWMERAQCNGETEQRCTVNRAKREETFA